MIGIGDKSIVYLVNNKTNGKKYALKMVFL